MPDTHDRPNVPGDQSASPIGEGKLGKTVLLGLRHGGHVLDATIPQADEIATRTGAAMVLRSRTGADVVEFSTPFCYLFEGLARQWPNKHLPNGDPAAVAADLQALADAMVDQGEDPNTSAGNSIIPPVYTYWGQFIDHDITANTDRDAGTFDITRGDLAPLMPSQVTHELMNLRQPSLNLEHVYGDGPTLVGGPKTAAAGFYEGVKLRIGRNGRLEDGVGIPAAAEVPPPVDDFDRDLPRIGDLLAEGVIKEEELPADIRSNPNRDTIAYIGDGRNDENLLVAQFHLSVLRFHNAVVDQISPQAFASDAMLFENARNLTRWHYQWLVVNDFLRTVCLPGIPEKVLLTRPRHYHTRYAEPFTPLEFSVAGYRFGHSMVRAAYDFNRNFAPDGLVFQAPFNLLFQFTGRGSPTPFAGQGKRLPFSWVIEWDRFIDKGSTVVGRFARKIDTRLSPPLHDLTNEGNATGLEARIRELLKRLARRNLLRGYLLSLPTGQAVAEEMSVAPLSEAELRSGNTDALNAALENGGFLERTPLWYYVLKEAEVRAHGNSLGELGSRLVCETIIGLLYNDPSSYLNQPGGWDPSRGALLPNGDPITTIGDFLAFAGVLPR